MKKYYPIGFAIAILAIIIPLFMPLHPAYASNITGATYIATIDANATSTYYNQSANFSIATSVLQANNYLNPSFNNSAVRTTTGADVAYMPSSNTTTGWTLWVDSITANVHQNYFLYMGGTVNMASKIRYFPGSTGMSISDSGLMLSGTNWTLETSGYFDASAGTNKYIAVKPNLNISNQHDIFKIMVNQTNELLAITNNLTVKDYYYSASPYTYIPTNATVNWYAQSFTPASSFWLGGIGLWFGPQNPAANSILNLRIRTVDGSDKPTGGDLAAYSWTNPNNSGLVNNKNATLNMTNPVYLTSGQKYAFILSGNNVDGANRWDIACNPSGAYAGGMYSQSSDSGTTWTTNTSRDFNFYLYGQEALSIPVSSNEHTLKVTSNATAIAGYWDNMNTPVVVSNNVGSFNLTGSPTTNYNFFTNNSMPYVSYLNMTANDAPLLNIQWENAATFTDSTGNGHNATPSFASPSNITAAITAFNPVSTSVSSVTTSEEESVNMVTSYSPPGSNYVAENMTPGIVGSEYLNAMLDAGQIPRSFVWFLIAFGAAIGAGFFGYYLMSRHAGHTSSALLTQAIISGVVLSLFSIGSNNIVPWYCVIIFIIEVVGIILAQKQTGW